MEGDTGGELLGGLLDESHQRLLQVIMVSSNLLCCLMRYTKGNDGTAVVQSRGCMPISELREIVTQMRGTQVNQGTRDCVFGCKASTSLKLRFWFAANRGHDGDSARDQPGD
jgi:hypothetical protein